MKAKDDEDRTRLEGIRTDIIDLQATTTILYKRHTAMSMYTNNGETFLHAC
jgi:hypothetical protein